MSDGPLHLKNSAQAADTYHSHSIGILGVGPFSHAVQFLPYGWVPNTFENMVALNTAVACRPPKVSILNFGELAFAMR